MGQVVKLTRNEIAIMAGSDLSKRLDSIGLRISIALTIDLAGDFHRASLASNPLAQTAEAAPRVATRHSRQRVRK